jgi:hypothetical protein
LQGCFSMEYKELEGNGSCCGHQISCRWGFDKLRPPLLPHVLYPPCKPWPWSWGALKFEVSNQPWALKQVGMGLRLSSPVLTGPQRAGFAVDDTKSVRCGPPWTSILPVFLNVAYIKFFLVTNAYEFYSESASQMLYCLSRCLPQVWVFPYYIMLCRLLKFVTNVYELCSKSTSEMLYCLSRRLPNVPILSDLV